MKRYVLATNNPGKLREMRAIFQSPGRQLLSLSEAGAACDPEETGLTFTENAVIKAKAAMEVTGLAAIADDSGLVIDALGGRPGVHSSRYARPGSRKRTILEQMKHLPRPQRTARFVSVVACAYPGGRVITAEGVCEGEIALDMRGTEGFGYDPIFYVPEYGCTFAEMSAELKNAISHRAKAFHNLNALLSKEEETQC